MNQLQLKKLAHKVLTDDRLPVGHPSKTLARAIMIYFDPEYFSVPTPDRESRLLKRTRPWEL